MPDGVFGYGSVVFRSLFDDGGEVAATAVFHENVENSSVSVDVSVMVSYNVVVMQVFENVTGCKARGQHEAEKIRVVGVHFSYNLLSVSLSHPLKVQLLPREDLAETKPVNISRGGTETGTHQTIRLPPNFSNNTKRAVSNNVQRFVTVEKSGRRGHG